MLLSRLQSFGSDSARLPVVRQHEKHQAAQMMILKKNSDRRRHVYLDPECLQWRALYRILLLHIFAFSAFFALVALQLTVSVLFVPRLAHSMPCSIWSNPVERCSHPAGGDLALHAFLGKSWSKVFCRKLFTYFA